MHKGLVHETNINYSYISGLLPQQTKLCMSVSTHNLRYSQHY